MNGWGWLERWHQLCKNDELTKSSICSRSQRGSEPDGPLGQQPQSCSFSNRLGRAVGAPPEGHSVVDGAASKEA